MISIKVLISLEIARFIPKCTGCFVDLTFTCMLETLTFTVDNYILKKKKQCIPRPVTIAIVYSLGEYDFIISYSKMPIILLYYSAISKEIILFVNQASLR